MVDERPLTRQDVVEIVEEVVRRVVPEIVSEIVGEVVGEVLGDALKMINERFDRLEAKVDNMAADIADLKDIVGHHEIDIRRLKRALD